MKYRPFSLAFGAAALFVCLAGFPAIAQDGPQTQSDDTVAKPKDKPSEQQPDQKPIPSEFKKKEADAAPDTPTFTTNATTVNVDVSVLDDRGHFIPKIPQGNFRISEDGVPQQVVNFGLGEAPMNICLLLEFDARFQQFYTQGWYETLQAAYTFLSTLKPEDNVAVAYYDMHTTILSDFSPDKNKAEAALNQLRIPGFAESNVFDALNEIATRMSDIEGRKAIVLIGSGLDTFSKLTFDKARRALQEDGVPIYTISTLQAIRIYAEARGMGPLQEMDFLQADNEMRTFAKETGGMSFFPRFIAEYPTVYNQIENALRNQYSLAYHPTNVLRDGKFRRIKVELVNPSTNEPLRIVNEKGKPIKYQVVAKAGYKAPRPVE